MANKMEEATGSCERTVSEIVSKRKTLERLAFVSPAKGYKAERKKIIVHDIDVEGILRTLHEFCKDESTQLWNLCFQSRTKEGFW